LVKIKVPVLSSPWAAAQTRLGLADPNHSSFIILMRYFLIIITPNNKTKGVRGIAPDGFGRQPKAKPHRTKVVPGQLRDLINYILLIAMKYFYII
jgi:hypothetical protein